VPPRINFTEATLAIDTCFQISEDQIPLPNKKNIYIEDITGVQCPNCPRATERIKEIKGVFPGGVVSVALYTSNFPGLTLPKAEDIDLRREEATDIHSELYDRSPMPGGGINRRAFPGEVGIRTNYLNWSNYAQEIREEDAPIDLKLFIDSDDKGDYLRIETITLKSLEHPLFVYISLLEDSLIAPQKTYDQTTIYDYVHNYVLREMITPFNGDSWCAGDLERGNKSVRAYKFVLPDFVKKENASFAVAIGYNNNNSKEILQAASIKLK
jgi:hypothetical protein